MPVALRRKRPGQTVVCARLRRVDGKRTPDEVDGFVGRTAIDRDNAEQVQGVEAVRRPAAISRDTRPRRQPFHRAGDVRTRGGEPLLEAFPRRIAVAFSVSSLPRYVR